MERVPAESTDLSRAKVKLRTEMMRLRAVMIDSRAEEHPLE